jgi:predicted CopG family antitoxin
MCTHHAYRKACMARQISVSNEVYELLSKRKGKKSFSQVIKENLRSEEKKLDIMSFAGIMKEDKQKLELLKSKIAAEIRLGSS